MLYLLIFSLSISPVRGLSPFLSHYEPLNYRTTDLARVSRSAQPHDKVNIEFDAFNRTFKLRLRKISPEESVFAEDATIEFGNETMKVDRGADIYKGFVEGDDDSRVFGSIHDGVFNGGIEMSDGKEYGIEYSARHNSSVPFHSFIYDVDHIKMPKPKKIKRPDGSYGEESMCGLSDPKIAESLKVDPPASSSSIPPFPHRSKRAQPAKLVNGFYDYRLCRVSFYVDHLLFKHYLNTVANNDRERTHKMLKALIEREINGVNRVYETTDFGGITGIVFQAGKTKIMEYPIKEGEEYPYKDENLDVNAFLGVNAQQNHGDACLGYVMTYRDFAGGTLGLAYVGGLCAPHRPNNPTQKSTNAGIVTYLNHGSPVLERSSYLTLAHEIGHNFGSNHDETDECKGEGDGQYIMWYAATSGDQPNNKRFSPCSIKQMTEKLKKVLAVDPKQPKDGVRNCFIASGAPLCGNGIVEDREVCDCGSTREECEAMGDNCCVPGENKEKGCTLKEPTTMKCAPSQGPCCSNDCTLKPTTETCAKAADCALESKCDGVKPKCPKAAPANDNKPCMDAYGACQAGECNMTALCTSIGMQECDSGEKTCMRHCMKDGVCQSSSKLAEFADIKFQQKGRLGHPGVMLRPMSQCLKGQGTCDQFDICHKAQANGFLGKSFNAFKDFGTTVKEKIWIPILIGIFTIILLVVIIKFCSYATPSSNPNKPKAKSIKQIGNMMSNRVKNLSKRAVKGKKGKAPAAAAGAAATPSTAAKTPNDKTKEKEEDDS